MTARTKQVLYDYFCSGGSAKHSISTIETELEDLIDTIFGTLTDYSATSTIAGWSSYTSKKLYYLEKPPLVFVEYDIAGTSDETFATFTLPETSSSVITTQASSRIQDNGGSNVWGLMALSADSSTVYFYSTAAGGAFTSSGTKTIQGQFWYVKA